VDSKHVSRTGRRLTLTRSWGQESASQRREQAASTKDQAKQHQAASSECSSQGALNPEPLARPFVYALVICAVRIWEVDCKRVFTNGPSIDPLMGPRSANQRREQRASSKQQASY
jgi:hypothetical protein